MRPSRLRSGEIVAGLGAAAVVVALVAGGPSWLVIVPLAAAALGALALVVTTLAERTPALPLAVGVVTVPVGLLAVIAALVEAIAEGGWPAWLGLAGALAILLGAWRALADERTDTREAIAQTERALSVRGAPRPVPPPLDSERHDRP
jgi:hypothetical protein